MKHITEIYQIWSQKSVECCSSKHLKSVDER